MTQPHEAAHPVGDSPGERIRFAREARNISARELARRAGLKNVTHVSVIESRKGGVEASVAFSIADALGVAPSWILFGGDVPDLAPFEDSSKSGDAA